jgi:hypothetical protein
MMAAMGLAGVGGLAMKALGVSMAALMLAGIVALKKVNSASCRIKDEIVAYRRTFSFSISSCNNFWFTFGKHVKHLV